jgi:hypothetical protein
MSLDTVDSFLVQPARGQTNHTQQPGTRVPKNGRLFSMLGEVFDRSARECRIDIVFRSDLGQQQNECQALLMQHLRKPRGRHALELAQRLAERTGGRSGLGLFFIMHGKVDGGHRLVLARFPADQGVLAEQKAQSLKIDFIEKVFMKSANAYKSVVYSTPRLDVEVWHGKAIDKQINGPREVSEYWIGDFLDSHFATTGSAGTRRFGDAIRRAARETDSEDTRAKLIAAAQLIPQRDGKTVSARGLLNTLGVPDDGVLAVERAMGRAELMDEQFQLSAEVFAAAATYQSVELDNGAVLMAETRRFGDVFRIHNVSEGRVQYSTEGKVIDQRLRKQK